MAVLFGMKILKLIRNILVIGTMINQMATELLNTPTVISMLEHSWTVKKKDTEFIHGVMDQNMKDSTRII